jgi:hypothetical protein
VSCIPSSYCIPKTYTNPVPTAPVNTCFTAVIQKHKSKRSGKRILLITGMTLSSMRTKTTTHGPWYAFDYKKDLDNGETSSQALTAKTTGDVLVSGAVEWKKKSPVSFFARHEIGTLHDRLKNGRIKSINHMKKDAIEPSQIMATGDKDGKLT